MGKRWPKPRLPAPNKPESKGPPLRRRVPTPPTDENVSPRTDWPCEHDAKGPTYPTCSKCGAVLKAVPLPPAIREAEAAAPALDVERLARAMCEVTMADGTPCQGHRRSAQRYAAEYARLQHPDSDGDAR